MARASSRFWPKRPHHVVIQHAGSRSLVATRIALADVASSTQGAKSAHEPVVTVGQPVRELVEEPPRGRRAAAEPLEDEVRDVHTSSNGTPWRSAKPLASESVNHWGDRDSLTWLTWGEFM